MIPLLVGVSGVVTNYKRKAIYTQLWQADEPAFVEWPMSSISLQQNVLKSI
jgi:hypothetical protein